MCHGLTRLNLSNMSYSKTFIPANKYKYKKYTFQKLFLKCEKNLYAGFVFDIFTVITLASIIAFQKVFFRCNTPHVSNG